MTPPRPSQGREAETIIADYLRMFTGDDKELEDYRPAAKMLLKWLEDEGWEIERNARFFE